MTPTRLYIKEHTTTGLRYFGKSVVDNIESYRGSGAYWSSHIKKHGVKFVSTYWVSDWFTNKEELEEFALAFSELFDVVTSQEWANLKPENGLDGGGVTGEASGSKRQDVKDKISKTKMSDEWKTTIGSIAIEKYKDTINSKEWRDSIGKKKSNSMKNTVNDLEWKHTIGVEKTRKQLETINSEEWQQTTGKRLRENSSKIQKDPEWKRKMWKACEHCNKTVSPGNYMRWHGNNCKANYER